MHAGINLTNFLFENQTYLTGALRKNRKLISKITFAAVLKKNEFICLQSSNNAVVLRYEDNHDILMLTNYTYLNIINVTNNLKLQLIINYNKGKTGVDLNDQNSHYSPVLRKSRNWLVKLALYFFIKFGRE